MVYLYPFYRTLFGVSSLLSIKLLKDVFSGEAEENPFTLGSCYCPVSAGWTGASVLWELRKNILNYFFKMLTSIIKTYKLNVLDYKID